MTTTKLSPVRYEAPCGMVAQSDDLGSNGRTLHALALTPCCKAGSKGSANSSTGVVCRACYREVSAKYGSWGWEALHQAARDAKCPCPSECADHALAVVMGDI